MYGQPKTRQQIGEEIGKKGKELTEHLRAQILRGGVIRRLEYVNPAKSPVKRAVYQTAPVNLELEI